jgi:hypothetical protein
MNKAKVKPARTTDRNASRSGRIRLAVFAGFVLVILALVISNLPSAGAARVDKGGKLSGSKEANEFSNLFEPRDGEGMRASLQERALQRNVSAKAKELRMTKAHSFDGDLRDLPRHPIVKQERPEREGPERILGVLEAGGIGGAAKTKELEAAPGPVRAVAAPTPNVSFDGLDFANWGDGHPPDTNGDVGPGHYIQTVNTSIGIYDKVTGAPFTRITFNDFMSAGNFGNVCDTDNFGDPVVVYDTFEDRWIITDFAFQVNGSGDVVNPPGAFQCFAVSKTGNPVSGGWNYYSINTTGGLGDYPKFGIWPDGLYMSANMFDYAAAGAFQNVRLYAFNKAQMYAGDATIQVVSFDLPSSEFTLLPGNARLQAGTPPTGSPNYFSTIDFLNALTVWKFHVDWTSISLSTLTGPFDSTAPASFVQAPDTVAAQGGNALDTLQPRLMMQNQYTRIGGVESLWNSHTVQGSSATQAATRYYQVTVTGGTVSATTTQAATHNPDTTSRYMPSVAVDRAGNMALGYTTSSSSQFPSIKYAGRLSSDPVNTLPLTETSLINGTGGQSGSCGGSPCQRWGDYSAMSLDPDGCTFWYTNEYYAVSGLNDLTRIGSFKFSPCTVVTSGTVQGTVTATVGGAPISGATVALGSRTTTTNGSGFYQFTGIPSGTYPSETASAAGYNSSTVTNIAVTDGATTTQNFSLGNAAASACLTDTTQANFQTGVQTNVDVTTSPGNVTLLQPITIDRQTTNFTTSGVGFNNTSFTAQTFTPGVTGTLQKLDVFIFCASCSGANPNITVEARTTSGGNIVMTAGGLLASAAIPGSSSPSGGFMTASFASPPTLTSGTQYGFVVRLAAARTGTQAVLVSDGDGLTGGRRQACNTSTCANATGQSNDIVFKSYMKTGFATSGDQVSSIKDANPAGGFFPDWTTLSWTATTPVNTTLRFQVAVSNNSGGPFSFVGPDGTSATFFTTSGSSLMQFGGFRYLKYKALLSTTNTAATPTVNDVTVCYTNSSIPTAAKLTRFVAAAYSDGVALNWETGYEVNNLGYHLYREENGVRVRVTPSPVAGSALKVGPRARMTAGFAYSWFDRGAPSGSGYYVESIDLNGRRELSGPIYPAAAAIANRDKAVARSLLLNQIAAANKLNNGADFDANHAQIKEQPAAVRDKDSSVPAKPDLLQVQQAIAAGAAAKISVRQDGWYRLTYADLPAGCLDPNADARNLQLYVDGEEVPMRVNTEEKKLGPSDTIEFYGLALDTPDTDTHVYWLINGSTPGKRITGKRTSVKGGDKLFRDSQGSPGGFDYTIERSDKLVYFAGLLNGDGNNIFGAPVTSEPLTQTLTVRSRDAETPSATIGIDLQGLTGGGHLVEVKLNGTNLGTVSFNGLDHPSQTFTLAGSLLHEGDNTLTVTATGGDSDVSLLDTVRLTYGHAYRADANMLRFSVAGGQAVLVNGFSSQDIRIIDITDPASPNELFPPIASSGSGYGFRLQSNGRDPRVYVAFADQLAATPAAITPNEASSWNAAANGADLIIVTPREFRDSVQPLVQLRLAQGIRVAIVSVEDVYDEFSYGAHSPAALKSFIAWAATHWQGAPHYLLLAGDSSWDPRNYLDLEAGDLVPTKLIDTAYMETASDDWLADFDGDGVAELATGRLPGRTAADINLMVAKILAFDHERQLGGAPRGALFVSDNDFSDKSAATEALVPAGIELQDLNRDQIADDSAMRSQIINALDDGPLLVNYYGHGSVTVWTGEGLLDADGALALTNGNRLSVFMLMTCLNGYSHDAYIDSLGEALLKAPQGGAVAVWASAGFTESEPQFQMNQQLYGNLFAGASPRLGDAIRAAKLTVTDSDVRRTWILLGDPTMRIR